MTKILIVDDEASIRSLLSIAFGRAGFGVQVAANPEEAMRLCRSDCFDVLLSDVVLPFMDGHALARWFAVQCPGRRVVLMSGFDPGCEDCPYASGCPLIRKPFGIREVVSLVRQALASPPGID